MADGLLNKASIILTPTGYKAGTLYNVAPIDEPYEDFDFARTSIATRINSSGLVSNVATGVPRISYDSNGENAHILLEPTSTNLVTYSEDFSEWDLGSNATLTYESDVVAPDGSLGVYRLTLPATSSTFLLSNIFSGQNPLALSIYAKSASTNNNFNLYDGSNSSSLKTASSEWQRFDYVGNGNQFAVINSGDTFITDIYIWGAQAEALSYSTSYIPTLTGSTETRATETATGAGSADLINSTEGVLYAEIAMLSEDDKDSNNQLFISDGTANQRVGIFTESAGDVRVQIKDSGETPDSRNLTALDQSESGIDTAAFNKIAILYKSGQNKLFVNGSRITDTNFDSMVFNFSSLDNLEFGSGANSNYFRGKCKALAVFNEALSDSELTQLTT